MSTTSDVFFSFGLVSSVNLSYMKNNLWAYKVLLNLHVWYYEHWKNSTWSHPYSITALFDYYICNCFQLPLTTVAKILDGICQYVVMNFVYLHMCTCNFFFVDFYNFAIFLFINMELTVMYVFTYNTLVFYFSCNSWKTVLNWVDEQ